MKWYWLDQKGNRKKSRFSISIFPLVCELVCAVVVCRTVKRDSKEEKIIVKKLRQRRKSKTEDNDPWLLTTYCDEFITVRRELLMSKKNSNRPFDVMLTLLISTAHRTSIYGKTIQWAERIGTTSRPTLRIQYWRNMLCESLDGRWGCERRKCVGRIWKSN